MTAARRGRPVGNKFAYDGDSRHPPVVRRHAASLGVQARLASRAVADRSRHGLCGRRGRGAVQDRPMAARPGASCPGLRGHSTGPQWAAGRRRHVPAHDPDRSGEPRSPVRRHLGGRRVPHRRWRHDVEADQPRVCTRSSCLTRRPRSATASTASRCIPSQPQTLFMQKHWDVMRTDNAGDSWHEGQRQPADRLRLRRSTCTPTSRRRSTSCRSRATPSITRPTASCGLPQPQRRQRVGGARPRDCRSRTATSTCCATRWPSTRWTVRRLLRHDRRPGLRVDRRRRHVVAIVRDLPPVVSVEVQTLPMEIGIDASIRTSSVSSVSSVDNPSVLPRTTCVARAHRWRGDARYRGPGDGARVIDALEARYPDAAAARSATTAPASGAPSCASLPASRTCPTIRLDAPLPDAVASGKEPFLIVGAIAGG